MSLCAALLAVPFAGSAAASRGDGLPPVRHVFTIVLENKNYDASFGPESAAPYLSRTLPSQGQLLTQFHGTGHVSLGNYITMISGQSENPATQTDCQIYNEMVPGTIGADGQAIGSGCVYPRQVKTVVDQIDAAGLHWRGYMQDMGDDVARDGSLRCAHPEIGTRDPTQSATPGDQYATRHNPFMYFRSVTDDVADCTHHVVNLRRLGRDLQRPRTTRNYTFITPDLCKDGHDATCADGSPGGYDGIDTFLRKWVPKIRNSPAFKRNGLLLVTFDESESGAEGCCLMPDGPNATQQGLYGPGGGRTGTVLLSPFIRPGSTNATPYNHYDVLHTVEDIFGLEHLGYAARPSVQSFGEDVFGGSR